MNEPWNALYEAAKSVIKPRDVSSQMSAGGVGAAVLSKSGRVYTGVCIDTSCSLGVCAERSALSAMLTNGEDEATHVCAVGQSGTVMPPCGACREFMMQLGGDTRNIEILLDSHGKTARLCELMPEYPYL